MDERGAFIRAIVEEPACDTRRLVFADWLDERGDERDRWHAAMIRGQWDTAGPSRWVTTFPDVADLAGELGASVWVDGFERYESRARNPAVLHVHRGFLASVRLPLREFLDRAAALFARHPLSLVRLTDHEPLDLPAVFNGVPVRPADLWEWHGTVHHDIDRAGLPWQMWAHRDRAAEIGSPREGDRARAFNSPEDARDWLSGLCVRHGRIAANLPALVPAA